MQQTVQQILRREFGAFSSAHRLPYRVHRAARALIACRTAALGGHKKVCANGHPVGVWYNSCRHRFCPQCSWGGIERWLEAKKRVLLAVPHRHVTFTIPHELLALWRFDRAVMTAVLFDSARETILQLVRDERWCGATPGAILSLHTWSRSLLLHPHLHCLVTEGGVDERGRWRPAKKKVFLPARVLRLVFEGKFQSRLEKKIRAGDLRLPPGLTQREALRLLKRASTHEWIVDVQKRYDHAEGVATYLARYLRGGPIKNQRLLSPFGGRIRFRPRRMDHRILCLEPDEFLGRLLQHVPLRGSRLVRSCGIYHHSSRLRGDLATETLPQAEAPRIAGASLDLCPFCGADIERIALRPIRPPPRPS